MLYLFWLGCTPSCPEGSSLAADGLCHLDPLDTGSAQLDTGDPLETDTDTTPAAVGDCPEEPSTKEYERYPVYIDGTDRRFTNIQNGIWGAEDGDTVVVCPGRYTETIDFKGKIITVRSAAGAAETVIDAQGKGSVVVLRNWEPEETILEGFTLTGGDSWAGENADGHGGGIFVEWGNPTIRHNVIVENEAMIAGGIYVRNGGAHISNNIIAHNTATQNGGGIVCTACYGEFTFNTIYHNDAGVGPAGEWYWGIADLIGNVIVSDEGAGGQGAFVFMQPRGDDFTVTNNLVWPHEDFVDLGFPDGNQWPDLETLYVAPGLVDPDSGDFRLATESPAVDAGPDGVLDVDGSPSDLGAFGGPMGDWGG